MNGWGAYCTFYFQGQSARTSTAYIYLSSTPPTPPTPPTPYYGTMSGTAYEGGAGYAIYLQNGTQVFVDSWNCNVEGQFYDGCSAIVYYTDYPSDANIYRADIYGNQGLIIPDDDQGGWAGSSTVTCPYCGAEVASAYEDCPYCGHNLWGNDGYVPDWMVDDGYDPYADDGYALDWD